MLRALWSRRHPTTVLTVEDGTVFCPRLGHDVDIERCLDCPRLLRIAENDRNAVTEVACDPMPRFYPGP